MRECDATTRKQLRDRMKESEDDIKSLKSEYQRAQENASRVSLMGRGNDSAIAPGADHRDRLLAVNQKNESSTTRLDDTNRLVRETEEIGVNIMDNMQSQRETLLKAKDKANETNQYTGQVRVHY